MRHIQHFAAAAACLALLVAPAVAGAQSSLPLLLEVARDPGRADTPLTSRALALGGARGVSERAEDALANPAGLTRGPAREVVFSAGRFVFGRDELALTPRQSPPYQPGRTPSPQSSVPSLFGAAVFRGASIGGGVFVDSTTRLSHQFTTAKNVLNVSAIPGVILETSASGTASLDTALTRVGGAFAASTRNHRASIGAAAYLARLTGTFAAKLDVDSHVVYYSPYPPSDTHVLWREDNLVEFAGWSSGLVVAGAVRPIDPMTLSVRWERAQPFASTRQHATTDPRSSTVAVPPEPVEWRSPPVVAFAVTTAVKRTTVVVEIARTNYTDVYGPAPAPISETSGCQTLQSSFCKGWGFGNYVAADSTGLRVCVEQGVRAGRATMWLRGGFAIDQAYTLARAADDPTIFALALPKPTIPTPFTPPRDTPSFWSIGWAITSGPVEVGFGLAFGQQQHRLLVDVRVARF